MEVVDMESTSTRMVAGGGSDPAEHLIAVDPAMERIVKAVGPITFRPPAADAFNALARSIVFQQLAGKAALAIHTRFAALFDGTPTATKVLQAEASALRGCGLSAGKTAALRDLALKAADGTVPLERIAELDDEEIITRLTTVRGIGRWTAQMFLIFHLHRPDVWPVDDFAVGKGYAIIYRLAEAPKPRELLRCGEIYRPVRSAAAWYCWRVLETTLPT
jgi:DNA-3-methyladenine glycosylase II